MPTSASPGQSTRAPAAEPAWLGRVRAQVWRYLRFLGCAADLADDFAQDTLLAALRAFPAEDPPMAWLCTTARNRLLVHLRTAGREVADLATLRAQWVEVAGDDGGDAQLAALRRCLDELPLRSRRVLETNLPECSILRPGEREPSESDPFAGLPGTTRR